MERVGCQKSIWAVTLRTPYGPPPRSNSARRTRTCHHLPALLLWCNGLLRKVSWWAGWWGSLDGMQGVRGSNPLSSTPGQRPKPAPTFSESPASGSRSAASCAARPIRLARAPRWWQRGTGTSGCLMACPPSGPSLRVSTLHERCFAAAWDGRSRSLGAMGGSTAALVGGCGASPPVPAADTRTPSPRLAPPCSRGLAADDEEAQVLLASADKTG
jgi:hypothetical protein